MKILFMEWKSIGDEHVFEAIASLNGEGYDIGLEKCSFDHHRERDDKEYIDSLRAEIKKAAPDFVFSFNFWPAISSACNEEGVKYVSWVYDNPAVNLFSYTLIFPCNYVFLFDSQMYDFFYSQGIENVYYLPMAAASEIFILS